MKLGIVTGANSGIGLSTTIALARAGYTIIMACVNESAATIARDSIVVEMPDAELIIEFIDLADFSTIQQFAQRILSKYTKLSLLVNNAGINNAPFTLTKNGFESTFQVNYLGHVLLTKLLMPLLEKEDDARVVNVTSYGHHNGVISFGSHLLFQEGENNRINLMANEYDPIQAYFNSKLANLLFSYELNRQLINRGSTVKSIAVHPGSVKTKMLQKNTTFSFKYLFFSLGEKIIGQTPEEGARCSIKASLDPEVKGGDFWGPDGPSELWGEPKLVQGSPSAQDEELVQGLWQHTTKLLAPFHTEKINPANECILRIG